MLLLATSCLIAGIAVAFDAVATVLQNRRLSAIRIRSLSVRHGLPERPSQRSALPQSMR
jgi:hypothetical protein